ncbi:MAG: VWA domain-containing protein [Acidobacteria bacterium]|nr:VWA domain-containing protein [Acidobacteriota bacterium]
MKKFIFPAFLCLFLALAANAQKITEGTLNAIGPDSKPIGVCPLKHTDVKAEITGFLSRVRVTQEFENSFTDKIEAVYVFPLPNDAAVDEMTMRIGERVVRGRIMRREQAREVYEAAKSNGQIASLLDQERTNIFTQSVANILPGEKITIEISYVETLKYEAGQYEFVFPMTVGPRYTPASVPNAEAARITPQYAEVRAGHDISVEVNIDAGVPIESVESRTHQIEAAMVTASSYNVKIKDSDVIPNKDFVLRYDVSGKRIEDAILTHRGPKGGYFTLILQPPDNPRIEDVTPKEIVFVLDTSGSMGGFPIEKAKESMKLALDGLNPRDTFNLITFAGDTAILFPEPVPATPENMSKAQAFLASREGAGGTEMMKAIRAALDPSDEQDHLRIVCFMTDGYVGNEGEIIAEVQKHKNARVFSFGIGSSVNRELLDKMAEEGRGEVEYVLPNSDGSAAAKRFHERVRSPLLTDISLEFSGLEVADVYPARINDLFSAKPIVVKGRFKNPASGVVKIRGRFMGQETVREIPVTFPENEPRHDVLATLWARTRIDELTRQDYTNSKPEITKAITDLALDYGLMTKFTSFVAVEERIVTDGNQAPRRIEVPVELPEGVDRKAIQELPVNGRSYSQLQTMSYSTATVDVSSDSAVLIDMSETGLKTVIRPDELNGSGGGRGRGMQIDGSSGSENVFVIDGEEVTNFRTENNRTATKGKATKLPKAALAKSVVWDGTDALVTVEVTIDATGAVTSATATSGNSVLRPAAETAARKTKFKIKQGSEPVEVAGKVNYRFTPADRKGVPELGGFAVKPTPAQIHARKIAAKYSGPVAAIIERLKSKSPASPDESRFVVDGKAEIVVRLTDLKPETISALKAAGFEVLTEVSSISAVVGRIGVEKIAAIAELDAVTYISPQYR